VVFAATRDVPVLYAIKCNGTGLGGERSSLSSKPAKNSKGRLTAARVAVILRVRRSLLLFAYRTLYYPDLEGVHT
jgi:hypothetical protein